MVPVAEKHAARRLRPRIILPLVAVIAVVVLGLLTLTGANDGWHLNDIPGWPEPAPAAEGPHSFAEGGPLHCSGVETMTPEGAVEWLNDNGYEVAAILEARPDGASVYEDVPDGSRLREVQVTASRGTVEVVTDGHPEYEAGYTGRLPKQDC